MGSQAEDDVVTHGDDPSGKRLVTRRNVLRFGGVVAASAGAAALISIESSDDDHAQGDASTVASSREAFGGVTVPPRALDRWMFSRRSIRHIACIGDSITQGTVGRFDYAHGGDGSWVERLGTATGHAIGPNVGYGFRGLWLGIDPDSDPEWHTEGAWTKTTKSDAFDVCPFGDGARSDGGQAAALTWTKPPGLGSVAGFDLYWFNMPGAGNWQYRIDDGNWSNMGQSLGSPDNKLHKFYVPHAVRAKVQIRAYNGTAACIAPIGGIGVYSADPRTSSGIVVHNLGRDLQFLETFVRNNSAGDPLAWLDSVVSNPVSLGFRPDLVTVMFSNDALANDTARWQRNLDKLISRVRPYADILLLSPFEQNYRANQANYRSTTKLVAAAHGCALLDLHDAYAEAGDTGWAAAKSRGLMYDDLHPSQLGHVDIAARVWRVLRVYS